VQKVILEAHPDLDLKVFIVWIKMYPADTIEAAQEASKLFSQDGRVVQYYDPYKFAGGAIAEGLGAGAGQIAWDIYLFYDGKARWGKLPPPPREWAHQLGDSSWADPDHFYTGDGLYRVLENFMADLLPG
jgi:hypothetical protein